MAETQLQGSMWEAFKTEYDTLLEEIIEHGQAYLLEQLVLGDAMAEGLPLVMRKLSQYARDEAWDRMNALLAELGVNYPNGMHEEERDWRPWASILGRVAAGGQTELLAVMLKITMRFDKKLFLLASTLLHAVHRDQPGPLAYLVTTCGLLDEQDHRGELLSMVVHEAWSYESMNAIVGLIGDATLLPLINWDLCRVKTMHAVASNGTLEQLELLLKAECTRSLTEAAITGTLLRTVDRGHIPMVQKLLAPETAAGIEDLDGDELVRLAILRAAGRRDQTMAAWLLNIYGAHLPNVQWPEIIATAVRMAPQAVCEAILEKISEFWDTDNVRNAIDKGCMRSLRLLSAIRNISAFGRLSLFVEYCLTILREPLLGVDYAAVRWLEGLCAEVGVPLQRLGDTLLMGAASGKDDRLGQWVVRCYGPHLRNVTECANRAVREQYLPFVSMLHCCGLTFHINTRMLFLFQNDYRHCNGLLMHVHIAGVLQFLMEAPGDMGDCPSWMSLCTCLLEGGILNPMQMQALEARREHIYSTRARWYRMEESLASMIESYQPTEDPDEAKAEVDVCAICREALISNEDKGVQVLLARVHCPGSHCFHDSCARSWVEKRRTCPMCLYSFSTHKYPQ